MLCHFHEYFGQFHKYFVIPTLSNEKGGNLLSPEPNTTHNSTPVLPTLVPRHHAS